MSKEGLGLPNLRRLTTERLRLTGSNCDKCGKKHFPKKPVCPDCGAGGVAREVIIRESGLESEPIVQILLSREELLE